MKIREWQKSASWDPKHWLGLGQPLEIMVCPPAYHTIFGTIPLLLITY